MKRFAPAGYNSDASIVGKAGFTRVAEVMMKYKDGSIMDRNMVWNTDLIESLELETLSTRQCMRCIPQRLAKNLVEPMLTWSSRKVTSRTGRCRHCLC